MDPFEDLRHRPNLRRFLIVAQMAAIIGILLLVKSIVKPIADGLFN
jgi:hypothetical protein